MRFPLFVDLHNNNCIIFGGDKYAAACAVTLQQFGARITVISPTLSKEWDGMDVRHLPRRYTRGDCSYAYLCVVATDSSSVNISIASECKAKNVPVHVTDPAAFGNFDFPHIILKDDVCIALSGTADEGKIDTMKNTIAQAVK
ncbi:MAG: NAD(P)-dependent oxidoreductase [Oscillospiraceae bacterium]|nr:NAD(P)-dependent oxidoreductase [Oscillospiraceae bacterium]